MRLQKRTTVVMDCSSILCCQWLFFYAMELLTRGWDVIALIESCCVLHGIIVCDFASREVTAYLLNTPVPNSKVVAMAMLYSAAWSAHLTQLHELTSSLTTPKHLTVPEAADAVHGGHLDDKGKHVIDEGVEGLVGEHAPGQVGHRLQLVVDEQLRGHCDETCMGGGGERVIIIECRYSRNNVHSIDSHCHFDSKSVVLASQQPSPATVP